jgi:hypothetical protein
MVQAVLFEKVQNPDNKNEENIPEGYRKDGGSVNLNRFICAQW